MLIAMGAVAVRTLACSSCRAWARVTTSKSFSLRCLPLRRLCLSPAGSHRVQRPAARFRPEHNGDLREEFGWDELVRTVAGIRDSLPPDQQAHLGHHYWKLRRIWRDRNTRPSLSLACAHRHHQLRMAARLPDAGAHHLHRAWDNPGTSRLDIYGLPLAGHNGNSDGIKNEESQDHPDIFVCGPPRKPWSEFWKESSRLRLSSKNLFSRNSYKKFYKFCLLICYRM